MKQKIYYLFYAGVCFCMLIGCDKYLPQERETVSPESIFSRTTYNPVLGRSNFFDNNFFKGATTFPSDFKIVNPRYANGDVATELTNLFPVKVWKQAYTANETSLEEIEAKREIEYRPIFEIGPHSGTFTMWSEGASRFIRTLPDSGYLFDVELSNSGGRRYLRNIKLQPYKERPFEPTTYDPLSGQPVRNNVNPTSIANIKGAFTDRNLSAGDVQVYIRKYDAAAPGNSLRFKFLDTLYNPINPDKFATTNWAGLVHGFDMVKTNESVTYKVAYPIPLISFPTNYTNTTGDRASVEFTYNRIGFGNVREFCRLGLEFAIFEPGDWEIVFAFRTDNPKFEDD